MGSGPMIANIVNTLIGLWLTYVAIFAQPSGGAPRWALSAAGLAIVLLAIAARRSDFSGWQSATNIVLGAVLIIVAAVNWVAALPPLLMFWVELYVLGGALDRARRRHVRSVGGPPSSGATAHGRRLDLS